MDWDDIAAYGYPKETPTTLDWEADYPYGTYDDETGEITPGKFLKSAI